jgi:hypothetical protein
MAEQPSGGRIGLPLAGATCPARSSNAFISAFTSVKCVGAGHFPEARVDCILLLAAAGPANREARLKPDATGKEHPAGRRIREFLD